MSDIESDETVNGPASEASLTIIYTPINSSLDYLIDDENRINRICPDDFCTDERLSMFFDEYIHDTRVNSPDVFYYYYGITYVPTLKRLLDLCDSDNRFLMFNFQKLLDRHQLELYEINIEYKNHYHLHGTVRTRKVLNYKSLNDKRGWHVYCKKITNLKNWTDYCEKDKPYKFL